MGAPEVGWVYRAIVVRCLPGFVFDCVVDLGFRRFRPLRTRLVGVVEVESEVGRERAGNFVRGWIEGAEREVTLRTVKVGESYLADFWRAGASRSLAEDLLAEGHAIPVVA